MSGDVQHDCMPSTLYLPQGKERLLERHPLSQKKKFFTSASTLLRLIRTKQILRWNHQANELQLPPVVETSESIEPNDTDLELNAIGYPFSEIF